MGEIWNPMKKEKLNEWFQTWSVLQFWWAVLVNILSAVLLLTLIADSSFIAAAIQNAVIGIVTAFIWAHVGWFSIMKKNGCCCFLVFCITDAPIFSLIYGSYCIPITYMGIACVKIWMTKKSEPPMGSQPSKMVIGKGEQA